MGRSYRLSVKSPETMVELGTQLGKNMFHEAVLGLSGPLGAGKTTLARGIAKGLGIDAGYVVSSPTYTLMQSYPCAMGELHHLDLYRITGPEDLESTGYRDHLGGKTFLVVEWPEREPSVLPHENLVVVIEYRGEGREVRLVPSGGPYDELVKKILERFHDALIR